ncbi:hypothetical protein HYPSUDRAFT_206511 [Hypholoma sublateritium FD-334 SS-4]|uniref:Uncharacterized protein n=1 Tax=Hypholoma sublateritium (strain FD-334 SS-4) TaxID=945553 RepID=A0A0D2P9K8_HYPSF|nr:hypothetical protein HYPSUDRAFT_206511 [Hypholoma sublateritium FD-334 SS-4]
MSPHRWTTPAQLEFLESKQADYLTSKAKGLGAEEFYRVLFEDFFKRWPEQTNESAERALLPVAYNKKKKPKKLAVVKIYENHKDWRDSRKRQIKQWYANHPIGIWHRAGKVPKVVLSINPIIPRAPTEVQVYSTLYFDDRVRAEAQADPLYKNCNLQLSINNKYAAAKYEHESAEIKKEVRRVKEERTAEIKADRDVQYLEEGEKGERSPEHYQGSIDKLPMIIKDFLQQICALTRWQSTFWAGGPSPEDGGDIKTISIHSCTNEEGLSFGDYLTRFDDGGLKQFSQFLHRVYPSEARKTRALPSDFKDGESEKTDSEDDDVVGKVRMDVHTHSSASGTVNPGATAMSASSSETTNSDAKASSSQASGALGMGGSVSGAVDTTMRASGSGTGNLGATSTMPAPTTEHQLFDGRTGGTGSSEGSFGNVPSFNTSMDLLGLMGDASGIPQPVTDNSSMFDGWGNFLIGGQTHAPQNWNGVTGSSGSAQNTQGWIFPGAMTMPPTDASLGYGPNNFMFEDINRSPPYSFVPDAMYGDSVYPTPSSYNAPNIPGNAAPPLRLLNTPGPASLNTPTLVLGTPVPQYTAVVPVSLNVPAPALLNTPTPALVDVPGAQPHVPPVPTFLVTPNILAPQPHNLSPSVSLDSPAPLPSNASTLTPLNGAAHVPVGALAQPVAANMSSRVPDTHSTLVLFKEPIPPVAAAASITSAEAASTTPPIGTGAGTPSGETSKGTPHIPDTADAAAASKPLESNPASRRDDSMEDADPASSANVNPPLAVTVSDAVTDSTSQPSAGPSRAQDRSLRTRQAKSILSMWLPKIGQTFLQGVVDLEAWQLFLQDWFAFELEVGATNTTAHRLPTSELRPSALNTWMQKRAYDQVPAGAKTPDYANQWIAWWNGIQPMWRRSDNPNSLPLPISAAKGGDNIDSLKKTGPCGLGLVIFGLAWWAHLASTDSRWRMAVDDMHNCIKLYVRDDSPKRVMGRSGKRKDKAAAEGNKRQRTK